MLTLTSNVSAVTFDQLHNCGYVPEGLPASATTAATSLARCFGLIDSAGRETRCAHKLHHVRGAEACVSDNALICAILRFG